jgi:toxin ParE1/3/4
MSAHRLRLVVDENAQADLQDALVFTQLRWGVEQRRTYRAQLYRAMRSLLDFPELGPARFDIFPGCRVLPVGEHVIYYRLENEQNEIVVGRLLHRSRDPYGKVDF